MKYVMSDIHGMYDKYIDMLKLINFSDEDELYILGDIIDRGKDSMCIYKHIIQHSNIHMLKGNHELMYQEWVKQNLNFAYSDWKYNGGNNTKKSMYKEEVSFTEFYRFVYKLPIITVVDNFILAHADVFTDRYTELLDLEGFIDFQDEEYVLWNRSNIGGAKYKDYQFVFGHTPVQHITGQDKIYHINSSHYIDCGACFGGKLSCLRLDDMKEFYV